MLAPLIGLAACATTGDGGMHAHQPAAWTTLSGTAAYRERIALPPNARLEVEIRDVSLADAPAPLIASVTIDAKGRQVPLPFALRYDNARLDLRHNYAVSARITAGGELLWITDTRNTLQPGQTNIALNLVSARR
ncbi:MAG: YbaY family lipoprotein [Candidatus Sphingomonas colombiensis]|nr:YbaY family lipoprotein [Sphingomonas sp.]WEK43825.1 MAG: YbaY family lipoprotein [Sphingomonas sp.]